MKALMLLAHGSRRKQSNVEVVKLTEKIKGRCSAQFEVIYPAFLELSSPSIPEGIKCVPMTEQRPFLFCLTF